MSELLANVAMGAAVLLTGVAALLFVVGIISWRRVRHPRLFWVAGAFGILVLQGLFFMRHAYDARGLIAEEGLQATPVVGATILSLGVAAALYLAALRR